MVISNKEATDLSELKLISPLLDEFMVGEAFSDHDGVRCYPAMKRDSDERYILKVISIPASQVRLDALMLTGAFKDQEGAISYFGQLARDVENELAILDRLAKMEGFLPYEACQIAPKEDSAGFDVYLLGTYKRSLERHFRKYPMTHLAAVNLGLDMCACLTVCRQAGFLYADLKPGNIYISDDNEYRIGDIGFLPIVSLKYASLPDRYRSAYTPPELADPFAPISPSIDIYAAGLILYQAYNGGVLPFSGQAPTEPLPAPLYADYEMSEIILKACAPNPADRWEDPIKMGQALVGYMQRNGVNDTPIIPPSVQLDSDETDKVEDFDEEPVEETDSEVLFEQADEVGQMMIEHMLDPDSASSEETVTEVAEEAEEPAQEEEDITNLSFLDDLAVDETVPQEEMAEDVVYSDLTDDVTNMLEQADDLIAHEAPAPAVAPDPVEIPVPEPILPEPEVIYAEEDLPEEDVSDAPAESSLDETVAAISEAVAVSEIPVSDDAPEDIAIDDSLISETQDEPVVEEENEYFDEETPRKNNLGNKILAGILAVVILACLAVAGFIFYRDYYIKVIDDIQLTGVDNTLTVSVSTKADHNMLTVVCTDTYGNKNTAPLKNGFATFTDLTPDSLYTVTVDISGFHSLKGETRATFTTAPQTEIMSMDAIAGIESGTMILSFTTKGHDYDQWTLVCTAPGEPTLTTTFSGHMATVTGLTVGKTYTLTLDAAGNGYVVGKTTMEYTVTELVYAEDLKVTSLDQNGLVVTWETPEGMNVSQWTVLCYNASGFSQNVTTAENTATFTEIDPTVSYSVKVTASGMSDGKEITISANAITVTNFNTAVQNGAMSVNWEFSGKAPNCPWVLTYTIDGYEQTYNAVTNGNSATIGAVAPGAVYLFKLQLQDGVTSVICSEFEVTIPSAPNFGAFGIAKENMTWLMCLAPNQADWNRFHVTSYQTSFVPGQKAGFVAYLHYMYGISYDPLNLMYVIRNDQGQVISIHNTITTWTALWLNFYGHFTVPTLPQTAGDYTMDIYFNGASVHQQSFSITE